MIGYFVVAECEYAPFLPVALFADVADADAFAATEPPPSVSLFNKWGEDFQAGEFYRYLVVKFANGRLQPGCSIRREGGAV